MTSVVASPGRPILATVHWGWAAATLGSIAALWLLVPTALVLLAIFGVIIITHEAGHLLAARDAGMKPTEFYWGFGPEIVGFDVNGCRYGLKAVFLGGYVKIEGMTPTSTLPAGFAEADTYRAASTVGRLNTILAGPFINLGSSVLAFAAAARLDGATVGRSFAEGFENLWLIVSGTFQAFWMLGAEPGTYANSVVSADVEAPVRFLSPVAQVEWTSVAVQSGGAGVLIWFGILSAAVGIVNLLPLPPLDGGHAITVVLERVVQVVRRDRSIRLDMTRAVPLAYVTIAVLVLLSISALIIDLRDNGVDVIEPIRAGLAWVWPGS